MKQLLTLFTALLLLTSTGYSIAGFGLHLDQGFFTVDETKTPLEVAGVEVGSITHHGFSNGYGIGGYLYVDAIPMVDIDLEAVMHLAPPIPQEPRPLRKKSARRSSGEFEPTRFS